MSFRVRRENHEFVVTTTDKNLIGKLACVGGGHSQLSVGGALHLLLQCVRATSIAI